MTVQESTEQGTHYVETEYGPLAFSFVSPDEVHVTNVGNERLGFVNSERWVPFVVRGVPYSVTVNIHRDGEGWRIGIPSYSRHDNKKSTDARWSWQASPAAEKKINAIIIQTVSAWIDLNPERAKREGLQAELRYLTIRLQGAHRELEAKARVAAEQERHVRELTEQADRLQRQIEQA